MRGHAPQDKKSAKVIYKNKGLTWCKVVIEMENAASLSPVWPSGHSKLLLLALVELLQMPLLPVPLLLRKSVRHRSGRATVRRVCAVPAATRHAGAAGALRQPAHVLRVQRLVPNIAQRLQICRCRDGR